MYTKRVFLVYISLFAVFLYSLTIAQVIPIEFANWEVQHVYYDNLLLGFPVALMLTLFWSIRKNQSLSKR
jgi:hypothetical protein